MLIGHRLNAERVQKYLYMSAKNIGNYINRFRDFLRLNSAVKLRLLGYLQGRSGKTWTRALQTAAFVMLFALSAAGQPIQSEASPGGNRVMFPQSFKEVATTPGAGSSGASWPRQKPRQRWTFRSPSKCTISPSSKTVSRWAKSFRSMK